MPIRFQADADLNQVIVDRWNVQSESGKEKPD